jgi:hypothetical protein
MISMASDGVRCWHERLNSRASRNMDYKTIGKGTVFFMVFTNIGLVPVHPVSSE